jgi:hypothetical protein
MEAMTTKAKGVDGFAGHEGRRAKTALRLIAAFGLATSTLLGCASSGGAGSTSPTGLDGTWDLVSWAGDPAKSSEITIADGRLTGSVTMPTDKGEGCSSTLLFAIDGDAMSGSVTRSSGCGREAGDQFFSLTGTRASRAGDSGSPWSGTWKIVYTGKSGRTGEGEVQISGLSAQAKVWAFSVAGGTATAIATKDSEYSFVAKKR